MSGIAIPYTFSPNTTILSAQVNANFSALGTDALNRTGDSMTGTLTTQSIAAASTATYDIGTTSVKFRAAYLSGALTAGSLALSGAITGATDITAATGAFSSNVTSSGTLTVTGAINSSSNVVADGTLSIATGKFAVDSSGNVTKVNNVTTSWPAAQGAANAALINDGSGTLSWGAAPPTGTVAAYAGRTAPSGWLFCDGSAVSRTTYSTLFTTIAPSLGTFTVTIASPGVFTLTSHGLVAGDAVYFTTTGALPTGLTANTLYYVISTGLTTNAFEVSTTTGGSAVNTSGTQSGTHTAVFCPYGLGDGSTTFNVPDTRQRFVLGKAASGTGNTLAAKGGAIDHTHTVPSLSIPSLSIPALSVPGLTITFTTRQIDGTQATQGVVDSITSPTGTGVTGTGVTGTGVTGTGTSGSNNPPYLVFNHIIKT